MFSWCEWGIRINVLIKLKNIAYNVQEAFKSNLRFGYSFEARFMAKVKDITELLDFWYKK